MTDARAMARLAREASRKLATSSFEVRARVLGRYAKLLLEREAELLQANARDLAHAGALVASGELSAANADRLKLDHAKLEALARGMQQIAHRPDPLGRLLRHTRLAEGLVLQQVTAPIGVLLIIFEARPDVLPQIAALAIASGNALLLKGGREAACTNQALVALTHEALAPELPTEAVTLVDGREAVADLLGMDDVIDLVIPRGSADLVRFVMARSKIPVLGHADGVCHVYVDASADYDMAVRIVHDSKFDYPSACNAMESLLVHRSWVEDDRLSRLIEEALPGVELFGDERTARWLGIPVAADLHHEYGDLSASVVLVDDVEAAIAHISRYSSGHTEAIVADDVAVAERFLAAIDSASVFHNASTRFADGFRYGLGAEVGISTSRIHARGPVGVEGLLTTRWLLRGHGQAVGQTRTGEVVLDPVSLPLGTERGDGSPQAG